MTPGDQILLSVSGCPPAQQTAAKRGKPSLPPFFFRPAPPEIVAVSVVYNSQPAPGLHLPACDPKHASTLALSARSGPSRRRHARPREHSGGHSQGGRNGIWRRGVRRNAFGGQSPLADA